MKTIHVATHHTGKWQVFRNSTRAWKLFPAKREARQFAITKARKSGGRVVVHDKAGLVAEDYNFPQP